MRFLKLLVNVFEGSLLCPGDGGGISGGDCGNGGRFANSGLTSPPPKLDKSMPSKLIGLLFGSGSSPSLGFASSGLELMVSPAGLDLDCRGMAPGARGVVDAISFCMSYPVPETWSQLAGSSSSAASQLHEILPIPCAERISWAAYSQGTRRLRWRRLRLSAGQGAVHC